MDEDINVESDSSDSSSESTVSVETPKVKNIAPIDWRQKGKVSSVKEQAACGSCWTFSTTGAIEAAYLIKHGTEYDLSEQQLVDCAHEDE